MSQTDLITMARFLVLPGAAELLEAFSQIPPGKLRESAVLHVQAIAETYIGAPASQQMPDPLLMASRGEVTAVAAPRVDIVEALSGPRRGTPKTDDPQVKAVELLLQARPPHMVANELGIPLKVVVNARKAAITAGVKFPPTPKGPPPSGNRKTQFKNKSFPLTVAEFNPRGLSIAIQAAERRGQDLETYVEHRRRSVEMAIAGRSLSEITQAVGESETAVRAWLNVARASGMRVPYMKMSVIPAQFEPVDPEPDRVVPLRTYQTEFHLSTKGLNPKAIGAIGRGASDMGVPLERYMQIRREAVNLFKAGQTNVEVMAACGITAKQASNWRTRAGAAGLLAASLSSPIERSIQTNLAKASEAMGETVEVYLQKRSRVYQMLERGLSPPEVARELNIPLQRVHNWANSTARGRSDAMAYA